MTRSITIVVRCPHCFSLKNYTLPHFPIREVRDECCFDCKKEISKKYFESIIQKIKRFSEISNSLEELLEDTLLIYELRNIFEQAIRCRYVNDEE
jgi:hypothetical protein